MRKFIYKGSTPTQITQFGKVVAITPGQSVGFLDHEWEMLCRDGAVPAEYEEVHEPEPTELVLPYGTPGVDLRTVPWNNKKLFVALMTRASTRYVNGIAESMRLLGFTFDQEESDNKARLVDKIVEYAAKHGWRELTDEQRKALPLHTVQMEDEANAVPAAPVAAAETAGLTLDSAAATIEPAIAAPQKIKIKPRPVRRR